VPILHRSSREGAAPRRRRRGISLIEIIIAMTLLAVVIGMLGLLSARTAAKARALDMLSARTFVLMQQSNRFSVLPYDSITAYAPRVDTVIAGRFKYLRRVTYKMPMGRQGCAIELVTDVVPEAGYTYRMVGRQAGQDQTGKVTLEAISEDKTRLHFEERYHLDKAPFKWFEGQIYGFINKQNEKSMQALSDYLTAHPDYAS